MNLYFLVEGRRTEAKVYPAWLQHLLPEYQRVRQAIDAEHLNYYLFSGEGYPSVLGHLHNAIDEVNAIGKYQFLLLCVDADEATVAEREAEIHSYIAREKLKLRGCELKIIVQNRALETWFLGNQKVYAPSPSNPALNEFVQFYNVKTDDPEAMGCLPGYTNHCSFHLQYLKEMFRERKLKYTKINPGPVTEGHYLKALQRRISQTEDLGSLRTFLDFCARMRNLT